MLLVAPSLEAGHVARLGEQLEVIRRAGARMIHIDVSDGHFAPDVCFGVPVIESIRKATDLTLDLHLLVERPERFVRDFATAGADRIAIHPEATPNLYGALRLIRAQGAIAGVALNPATPIEAVSEVLGELDFLNVLSSDPGGAEENYIPNSTSKAKAAAEVRARSDGLFSVQVEGGIDLGRLPELTRAGANIVVISSACLGQLDPEGCLKDFIRRASEMSEELQSAESRARES
jgi:ribulose-phosphate 3-epimerase